MLWMGVAQPSPFGGGSQMAPPAITNNTYPLSPLYVNCRD
jgi:hypothetical protein